MRSMPSISKPTTAPTMSMIESSPPISWKCTSSGFELCTVASACAMRRRIAADFAITCGDSLDSSMIASSSRAGRPWS